MLSRTFLFSLFVLIVACLKAATVPLGDFSSEIVKAKEKGTVAAVFAVCRSAIESERLDLALMCFDEGFLDQYCFVAKNQIADERLKDLAVLAVLSASSKAWHDYPGTMDYHTIHRGLFWFCEPVLKKYLPESSIVVERFYERSERLKIAEELKNALGVKGFHFKDIDKK